MVAAGLSASGLASGSAAAETPAPAPALKLVVPTSQQTVDRYAGEPVYLYDLGVYAVAEQAVSITGKLTSYTKPGGSGQPFTRRFCPVCGSRIAGVGPALPGMVLITASTLDDPEKFVSQMSVFASRAPSWDRPPADTPSFAEMPPPQ